MWEPAAKDAPGRDEGVTGGMTSGGPQDAHRLVTGQAAERTADFAGAGGVRLFRRCWRPAEPARAVVANVHGLGDHSGLYPTLVDHLVSRGITVHAPDLRGNGRSPGQRAYVARWEEFREDLRCFLEVVRAEDPGRPVFLLGNSLGGLIVLEYALHYP